MTVFPDREDNCEYEVIEGEPHYDWPPRTGTPEPVDWSAWKEARWIKTMFFSNCFQCKAAIEANNASALEQAGAAHTVRVGHVRQASRARKVGSMTPTEILNLANSEYPDEALANYYDTETGERIAGSAIPSRYSS